MEKVVKKYQQKFLKVKDEMEQWDQLQSQLLSEFRSASSIIEESPVHQDLENYGALKYIDGMKEAILRKDILSLEAIFSSITNTMEEFHGIVMSMEKIFKDGKQLVKGGSMPLTNDQMQLHIGILPSIASCLEGLRTIHEMHHDEYKLKLSIVSALPRRPSAVDLVALQRLLTDQPNIPKDEVQSIFSTIFPDSS